MYMQAQTSFMQAIDQNCTFRTLFSFSPIPTQTFSPKLLFKLTTASTPGEVSFSPMLRCFLLVYSRRAVSNTLQRCYFIYVQTMVETGERICEVPCNAPTFTVAWHPQKPLLAFACDDKVNTEAICQKEDVIFMPLGLFSLVLR